MDPTISVDHLATAEDYLFQSALGEGSFSFVHLAVHRCRTLVPQPSAQLGRKSVRMFSRGRLSAKWLQRKVATSNLRTAAQYVPAAD